MKWSVVFCLVLAVLIVSVASQPVSDAGRCQVGEEMAQGCNRCRCTAGGRWSCTRKACLRTKREERICVPGASFKKDCNNCICNIDGTAAACTFKFCVKP